MKKSYLRALALTLTIVSTVLFFQNCAEQSFDKKPGPPKPVAAAAESAQLNVDYGLEDQSIFIGKSTVFEVGVSGTGEITYQWSKDGNDLSGREESNLDIRNAQLEDAGRYKVDIFQDGKYVESSSASLEVLVCSAGSEVSCSTSAGEGVKICAANGLSYGSCQVESKPKAVAEPKPKPEPKPKQAVFTKVNKKCKSKTSTNCIAKCPSNYTVTGCTCNGTSWLYKCVKSGNGCNGAVKITRKTGGPWDWQVNAMCVTYK